VNASPIGRAHLTSSLCKLHESRRDRGVPLVVAHGREFRGVPQRVCTTGAGLFGEVFSRAAHDCLDRVGGSRTKRLGTPQRRTLLIAVLLSALRLPITGVAGFQRTGGSGGSRSAR